MASGPGKENIADGLIPSLGGEQAAPSPRKTKKTRSVSMGPASRNVPLKEDSGNRRKSAIVPAVKSILSTLKENVEDDVAAKRKEARRKSLANRRVSFAPEATLHTWDVIEYMRDATTSSASSELEPRASSASQASFKSPEPETRLRPADMETSNRPTTPPKQLQETVEPESSPGSQRSMHQKKRRRRSSGIPPPNFNSPHEATASPTVAQSPVNADDDDFQSNKTGDLAMDLDEDSTEQSVDSNDSTSSSARLDAALKQAAVHAGTQNIRYDPNHTSADVDEVIGAFKPWAGKNKRDSIGLQKLASLGDQENVDPFRSPRAEVPSPGKQGDDDITQDMSMDMTAAIGGILRDPATAALPKSVEPNRNTRRRRSSTAPGTVANSTGSPFQRPSSRRSLSRRRSSAEESLCGDESMDLTTAIGVIQQVAQVQDNQQERSDSSEDQTMDFTLAVGGIKDIIQVESPNDSLPNTEMLEDMSMELTENIGKTLNPPNPATPSPRRSTRSSMALSLPSTITADRPQTPRKSPRKSMSPASSKRATLVPKSPKSKRSSPRKDLQQNGSSVSGDQIPQTAQGENESANTINTISSIAADGLINVKTVHPPAVALTNNEQPTQRTISISDSIKLLSTPRKGIIPSPALQPPAIAESNLQSPKKAATPKKPTTPRHKLSPIRSPSPRKRVRLDVAKSPAAVRRSIGQTGEDEKDLDPISLQDFLSMTNIRFMDLTTTKRRATGHPGADSKFLPASDAAEGDQEPSLENNVAAAIEIKPMLDMYHHSCQEMKSYINSGKTEVHNLEAAALENQPPLFHEYFGASAAEKSIMNAQLRDLKTNARLQSKAGWHNWRSQLLNDLKSGIQQTAHDLENDNNLLAQVEKSFQDILPSLVEKSRALETELEMLEKRKIDAEGNSGIELDEAREELQLAEREIEEKDRLLAHLKAQLKEKESLIDDARSWKMETVASINEADRVCEEYRGWSISEVAALQDKLKDLEANHGWSLVSVSGESITISHAGCLQLTIQPKSWSANLASAAPDAPNGPVSLDCKESLNDASALASPAFAVRQFFLRLLRAHAKSLPQCRTRLLDLLRTLSAGWSLAMRIEDAVRALEVGGMLDVQIVSDERLAVESVMLLSTLTTKILVGFEIAVAIHATNVEASVDVKANVVYGEKYDEAKMADFISKFVSKKVSGKDDMSSWALAVEDLKGRLLRRGAKGSIV